MAFCQIYDATLASLTIEQARKNMRHGQEDMNSWKVIFMGSGFGLGSLLATYFTHIKQPTLAFKVSFVICMILSVQAFFLSKDLEENKVAT